MKTSKINIVLSSHPTKQFPHNETQLPVTENKEKNFCAKTHCPLHSKSFYYELHAKNLLFGTWKVGIPLCSWEIVCGNFIVFLNFLQRRCIAEFWKYLRFCFWHCNFGIKVWCHILILNFWCQALLFSRTWC